MFCIGYVTKEQNDLNMVIPRLVQPISQPGDFPKRYVCFMCWFGEESQQSVFLSSGRFANATSAIFQHEFINNKETSW